MARSHLIWTETGQAAADLDKAQYHLLRLTAAGQVNISSQTTAQTNWGVLQNKPKTNEHATVGVLGLSKVVAGSSMAVNVLFTTSASGRAVTAQSGDVIMGRALEAPGADGDVFTAEIFRPWRIWTAP